MKNKQNERVAIRNSTAEFLIFATQNESDSIEVRFEQDTLWLTQQSMAELFQTTKQNISLHVQNILDTAELSKEATVKDFLTVRGRENLE